MLTFLNLILCVSEDNKTGLCVHNILLTRLGFCGPKGCNCTLSRYHGLREVAYLPTSLSTGKGTKNINAGFPGRCVKSDSCSVFRKSFPNLRFHNSNKCWGESVLLIHSSCVCISITPLGIDYQYTDASISMGRHGPNQPPRHPFFTREKNLTSFS